MEFWSTLVVYRVKDLVMLLQRLGSLCGTSSIPSLEIEIAHQAGACGSYPPPPRYHFWNNFTP